jgi:acyl-CoA thioesterase-1
MKRALPVLLAAAFLLAPLHNIAAGAPQPLPVIVVLGDSLTAGLGLPQDQSFPAQLEAALKSRGHSAKMINAGVSGDTAAAALKRLDWALPDDADAVIIELGGNDALQGLPPESTKAALAAIIERVQARGMAVLLAGMEAPRNMGDDYVTEFRAVYTDLAKNYDVIFYPFFLDGVALNDGLMQPDGTHPNAKGVKTIVEGILPKVEELLVRAQDQD